MERDGSFTHFAISAALTEQEMAVQERHAEELAYGRRLEYLEEVKAEVNNHKERIARVTEDLRTETENVETRKSYLNSLKHINETLQKEASALERQLFQEKEKSLAKQTELSTLKNSNDTLRRKINSVTKKVKSACGVRSLEKEVEALQDECEGKQASIRAVEEEIRQIGARAARARRDDLNKFIVKLAELKVGAAATERQIHAARAEVESLEATKRALEEEQRAQSKSAAQVRALPSRHSTQSPQSRPCAALSGGQASFPSTPRQGSANQLPRQSKGLPTRNVAPSKPTGPRPAPQPSTSSAQSPQQSRPSASSAQSPRPPQPSTSSAQSPRPPQPSTSSAQTPEPRRPSARSTSLGLSEYFDNLRMMLSMGPSPKVSAEKRPGPGISKPFFSPPPNKQTRIEGTSTAVPIPPPVAPPRPSISHLSAPSDKRAAVPAPPTPRPSVPSRQPTFLAAPRSAAPQRPQGGTPNTNSTAGQQFCTEARQGPNAAPLPAPVAVASPRPVRQPTSSIRHDARQDAPPRSFPPNYRAENFAANQSASPRPQMASNSGLPVSKHSSGETSQGHGATTLPTTPSRPTHQYTTTNNRDASQGASPRLPFPPKYRAQTFAAPQSAAPQPQAASRTDLPVGRCPPTEASRAHTPATVPTTSSGPGEQYGSSTRHDTSPGTETFPARQSRASEPQGGGPRGRTDTAQGGERPGPFSSPSPRRVPPPSIPVPPFRPPQRGRPAAAQGAQPLSGQRAPEHSWGAALPPAAQRQPAQSPTASFEWGSTPSTQVSETDQGARPPQSDASLRGSPMHSEFSFGASAQSPGGGGNGEDGFDLFGEDDDAGAGGGFQFSLTGAGNNPPRFNF